MIEIKDLLGKFDKILRSETGKKEAVRGALAAVLGIEIDLKDIKIKGADVCLNLKPIFKSEILLKNERILSELEKSLGPKPRRIL